MQPWSQPLLWPALGGAVSNVVLLDGFNGANGSTSSIDESPAAHGAATFAGTTTLSTTQAKFGTASLNNTSNITGGVTWPYSTDWALGSGKFTVECWYYANALGSKQALVAQFAGLAVFGWIFMLDNTNKLTWYVSTTGADLFTDLVQSSTFTSGTWHHCAVDFDGTKYRLYYDGVMVASSTTLRNIYNPGYAVSVGNDVALGNNYPMNGYLDEVRITKGVAQYASDAGFAVPTAAFPRVACATTTWNPSDKTTGMVLSNSNLTAYAGGTGGNKGVRSTASRTSGKLYFEIKVDTNNSSGAWSGVTVGTAFAPDVVTGDATHGAGVIWVTGNTNSYTTSGTSLGALAASNDILCFAIDIGGQLIWFRKNGGNWNGSGTANPATGIGGISLASLISTWGSGTFYAFTSTAQGFEQSTANFGWAAFSFAVPSGFVAWG